LNGFGTVHKEDGVIFSGNFIDGQIHDDKAIIKGLIGKSCTSKLVNGVIVGDLTCDFG
jgi:hypothetical protein